MAPSVEEGEITEETQLQGVVKASNGAGAGAAAGMEFEAGSDESDLVDYFTEHPDSPRDDASNDCLVPFPDSFTDVTPDDSLHAAHIETPGDASEKPQVALRLCSIVLYGD